MNQEDFIRLANDEGEEDVAYFKKDEVIAIVPRVDPKFGVLKGSVVMLKGGIAIGSVRTIEELADMLGIAQEAVEAKPVVILED